MEAMGCGVYKPQLGNQDPTWSSPPASNKTEPGGEFCTRSVLGPCGKAWPEEGLLEASWELKGSGGPLGADGQGRAGQDVGSDGVKVLATWK